MEQFQMAYHYRLYRLEAAVTQLHPLVQAIRSHEREHGQPPNRLDQLAVRLPDWERYAVRGCHAMHYEAWGVWRLSMDCPNGILGLDDLSYQPDGRYPTDGSHVRLGDWAYSRD
jgi:hypothetical protein